MGFDPERLRELLHRRRRAVALAGIALLLAAVGYVAWRLHGLDFETPVRLPRASAGELPDITGWRLVHLTADGEILCGGRNHSLESLGEAFAADQRSVLLCADAKATALDLYYLCDVFVLHGPGEQPLWLAVEDGWRRAALPLHIGIPDPPCIGTVVDAPDAISARPPRESQRVFWHWNPDLGPHALGETVFITGGYERVATRQELVEKFESDWEACEEAGESERYDWDGFNGTVVATSFVPVEWVVEAFDALMEADAISLWTGRLRAHPWVSRQTVLPRPIWGVHIRSILEVGIGYYSAVELPYASETGGHRDDGHDETRISVVPSGRISAAGRWLDSTELAEYLGHRTDQYALKQKRKNKAPYVDGWSPFIAHLRADKNTPWRTVREVLSVVRASRIRHVHIGTTQFADASFGREEAEALGAVPHDSTPAPAGYGESTLSVLLAGADTPAPAALTIRIRGAPEPVAYRLGDGAPGSIRDLAQELEETTPPPEFVVDAPPDLEWKYVVAALSVLARTPDIPIGWAPAGD